jgi:Undecaprenyl-phosphate glucose phosphotransferase
MSSAGVSLSPQPRLGTVPAAIFVELVRGWEVCALLAVGVVAVYGIEAPGGEARPAILLPCVALAAAAAAFCLSRLNAYAVSDLCLGRPRLRGPAIALLAGALVLYASAAVLDFGTWPATSWLVAKTAGAWIAISGLFLGATRVAVFYLARHWRRTGQLGRRVALVGSADSAAAFMGLLDRTEPGLLHVVGLYQDEPGDGRGGVQHVPNRGTMGELIADCQRGGIDAVIVTLPAGDARRMDRMAPHLKGLATEVYVCPCEAETPGPAEELRGLPAAVVSRSPLSEWQRVRKRAVDILGSAALLVMLGPVLLLIALIIRIDSAGPVLFRQMRIGYHNQPFTCFKFRTMYHHAADLLADRQTTRNDPRVTRVGRWLRRTSLDELPQLLNVFLGDMSLVGPRPHAPNTRAAGQLFADVVSDYAMRHRVKPGMTGWAQVNGWRGETATVEQIEQRVRHDLYYIQNWSLVFDIRILLMTATRGFSGSQAF